MTTNQIEKGNLPVVGSISKTAVIVVACYIGAQMIADIASLKIASIFDYAVDMGTFIYPISFTLRDLVHKTLGKQAARVLIICAAAINLFMVAYLWMAASAEPIEADAFNDAFSIVFAPLGRIVIASIVAEVVSELVDTEVYHWFVTRVTRRYQWLRVLLSNAVSIPIDNAIFVLGAFAFTEGMTSDILWEIFLFNFIVKFGVTLFSLPLIYLSADTDVIE